MTAKGIIQIAKQATGSNQTLHLENGCRTIKIKHAAGLFYFHDSDCGSDKLQEEHLEEVLEGLLMADDYEATVKADFFVMITRRS